VIQDAPDKAIIFLICGATLAVSSVLWLLVRDGGTAHTKTAGAPAGH